MYNSCISESQQNSMYLFLKILLGYILLQFAVTIQKDTVSKTMHMSKQVKECKLLNYTYLEQNCLSNKKDLKKHMDNREKTR